MFWPDDNAYYPGSLTENTEEGRYVVIYVGEKVKSLDLCEQQWRFAATALDNIDNFPTLPSCEQEMLLNMLILFANKSFMRHEAQGFEQFPMVIAYQCKEESFLKTVRCFDRKCVPHNANITTSHVLYNIKTDDNNSIELEARIEPHGNEDSGKTA